MAHFVLGEYEKALEYFAKAAAGGGGDIVSQSIADCRRAKDLAEQMRRLEERPPLNVAQSKQSRPTSSTTPGASQSDDAEVRLRKLKAMLDKGLITKAEYDKKKAEILKEF